MNRRLQRVLAAAASGSFLALAVAMPAHATNEINIDHVESGSGSVSMLLSADGLPEGSVVDDKTVSVIVDGNPVQATVETASSGTIQRSTVLVVGTSAVNQHAPLNASIPFPMIKSSGMGIDYADYGVKAGMRMQILNTNKASSPRPMRWE